MGSGGPGRSALTGESASSGGGGHGGDALPGGCTRACGFVLARSGHGRRGGSGGAGTERRAGAGEHVRVFPRGAGSVPSPGAGRGGASRRGGHGGAERAPPPRGRARPPARALRARAWPRREKRRWRRRAAAERRAASPCTTSAGSWASSGCTSTPCGCGTRSSSGWAPRPPWPAWPSPCAAPV